MNSGATDFFCLRSTQMATTLLDMLKLILTLIGEAGVAVLFFVGVSPEALQGLDLGYFEVGFIVAVIAMVVGILGVETYKKIRKRT
jgi:hypothetical protein